jgi:hypothetical protein
MSDLLARLREARATRPLDELPCPERIRRLPLLDPTPQEYPALIEKWTDRFHIDRPDRRPLRSVQALALEHAEWAASSPDPIGMLANIAVGGGKTLITFLLPKIFNAKRPVLLTKAKLKKNHHDQLYEWCNYYDFAPTRYVVDPYLRVVSYSELSQPSASALLRELNPDLIVADECHSLRHASAARTKRFLRYMNSPSGRNCRFVGMSGTLTNSSIGDYAHLSHLALRQYSPLPIHEHDVKLWGSVLNVRGEPDSTAWRAVEAAGIDTEGRKQQPTRENYAEHFSSVAGVVCSTGMSTEVPLTIEALHWEVPDAVRRALADLSEDWVLPDGTEVVDALAYHSALSQLSIGFYYVWDWPNDEPDEEWMEARRGWWKACREYLKYYSREGCDSPFLVEEFLRNSNVSAPGLRAAWARWEEQKHKDPPPTRAVWIDKTPVYQAVGTVLSKPEPTLLWFRSRAVGELIKSMGIPTYWQDEPTPGQTCALSARIHGTGKNYQAWARNIDLEPTTNAAEVEQQMGRTHRQGQEKPVYFGINMSTWAHQVVWATLLNKARYAQGITKQPQKILWGTQEGF